MAMSENKISVKIPEDARKYKEKILAGMTARQLISGVATFAVCVPLYWYGRAFIHEELLSWLVIFLAAGLFAFGFIRVNNMPFERFIMAFLEYNLLLPQKRLYKTANIWQRFQRIAERQEAPKGLFAEVKRRKARRLAVQASLERAALLNEAEQRGDIDFDVSVSELLTVRTGSGGGDNNGGGKKKKPKKNRDRGNGLSKRQTSIKARAEEIANKQQADPAYTLSKKEFAAVKRWKAIEHNMRLRERKELKKPAAKKERELKRRKQRDKSTLPRSTQQTLPYIAAYDDGVLEVTPGRYSKAYRVKDVNYNTIRYAEQEQIFIMYAEFLNFFDENTNFQIVVDNRVISVEEQERMVLSELRGDVFDGHREENNKIMRRQMKMGRNDIQVAKLVVVTIGADTAVEALLRFRRVDREMNELLGRMGSACLPMSTTERLSYYHDKLRTGREGCFAIDFDKIKREGMSTKDYIAPSYFKFAPKHLQVSCEGDDYYRVYYLTNLPKALSDDFLKRISNQEFPVTVSLAVQPVAQDKAIKLVKRQLTGVEANKLEAEKKAVRAGYSASTIRHDITDAHEQLLELYEWVMNKNQKMFFVTITVMIHGKTLEELENNCQTVNGVVRTYTAQLGVLHSQQEEGFKVTMPFGYTPQRVVANRMLTTEALAVFMPFSHQELLQAGGFYYGLNTISNGLVVVNRTGMKTPSGFVLGTAGSGKSFATKREMLNVLLRDNRTNVLIIDPENEYGDFCRAFGGAVVKISPDSSNHINPLDMGPDYGLDDNDDPDTTPMNEKKHKALTKKASYLMTLIERMMHSGSGDSATSLTPQQRAIVDRCIKLCYMPFLEADFDPAFQPTLADLQLCLDKERDTEVGREIADAVSYYTTGTMNVFANKTTVAVDGRLVVFNVRDLGDQLRQLALSIVFDFIWNRMIENKNKGVRTYCYCDEIHVMFKTDSSAEFLKQLYKRGRKYGLCITGLTQNVSDLLLSEQARGMIGNSDFIMMLNQHSEDLKILADMLSISEAQMQHVFGADAGSGLIFAENVIVPFYDKYPAESYLYRLMSTRFGEDMTSEEVDKQISEIMKGSVHTPPLKSSR